MGGEGHPIGRSGELGGRLRLRRVEVVDGGPDALDRRPAWNEAFVEEALMKRLVGKGSSRGSTWFGRAGDITKRPPVWAGIAGGLALTGPRGRQAAVRGGVSYVAATLAHLGVKAAVGRPRPQGATRHARMGPLTSSFPSGHCASELGFSLGAAQEIPWLFVPLYAATLAGEWSLVRSRAHYPSDVFAGAGISALVALVLWKVWPPHRSQVDDPPTEGG